MKTKELVCIVCPNGCRLEADLEEQPPALQVTEVRGHLCDKGPLWAEQELTNPVRTVTSSIAVEEGAFPLVSVRTDAAIPRGRIMAVMAQIKTARVRAPVRIGDPLIRNPAGTGCNIIATRNVKRIAP